MEINLLKYNRHWEKGFRYPFAKKRNIFFSLIETINKRQIVEIVGLRRTGKTTLLFQLINYLLESGIEPFSILYFTFDEERIKIEDLIKIFSKQTEKDFKTDKLYIFLDEIQKLPDFQNQIKIYYDLYPNLKFFLSGSSSFFIKKKTQESLAGRTLSFNILPLDFKEYLYFKDKAEILDKPLLYSKEIEMEFEIFLTSQFIESIEMNKEERKEYFLSIIKKIVFEDIPQIFFIENPEIIFKILKIIAQQPGLFIDYQNFSREIGVSNKTLSNYFYYLEEAFLIKKLYNFSRNLVTSEKKLKRFYLATPSFSWAMVDFIEVGKLVENFVSSMKNYKFFWRDPYGHEVDFVNVEKERIIPIEVKYKEKVLLKEMKNLVLFCRKFKIPEAKILMKILEKQTESINNLIIEKIPIFNLNLPIEKGGFSLITSF